MPLAPIGLLRDISFLYDLHDPTPDRISTFDIEQEDLNDSSLKMHLWFAYIDKRRPPHHVPPNPLIYSSSSHLLCRAFPRYTRFIRRKLARFSFTHRLAFFALFISVLLAFAISLSSSVAPKSHSANYRPQTLHPSFAHHEQQSSPPPSHSVVASIINAPVPSISSTSSVLYTAENETSHALTSGVPAMPMKTMNV